MAGYGAFNAGTVEYTVSADLSKFLNNTKGATDALDGLEDQAKKTDKGLDGFKKKTDKVADAVKQVNNETKGAMSSIAKFGVLLAAAVAANTLRNAIAVADAYGQMASRIRNATSSAEEYDMVQQRLLATANGTYRSLSEAQEIYLGLESSLKDLGYTTKEVLDITDSFSYALVRDAARKDQAVTATDALSKALMKGKIDADGFASIMAATPSILEGIAQATGQTTGEIRQLGATGKLSVEALNEGLLVSLERSKEMADNMKVSVGDAFTVLDNAIYSFIGRMDESSGATDALSSSIVEMSNLLKDPSTIEAAATLSTAIVNGLKSVIEFSVQAVNGIKDLGRELARITGGPDLENLFDVTRSLEDAREKLAARQGDSFQTKQTKLWKDRTAWLEKEIKRLEAAEHRILFPEQYANTSSRKPAAASSQASSTTNPRSKIVSATVEETKKASKAKKELTEWEKEGLEVEKLVLDTLIEINKERAKQIDLDRQAAEKDEADVRKYDAGYGATKEYQEEIARITDLNNRKLLSDQAYLSKKKELELAYNEEMQVLREQEFASQAHANQMMLDALNSLQGAATNTITGLITGATSAREAMQQLAGTILNHVVSSVVEMGIQQAKNMIMGSAYVGSVSSQVAVNTALAAQAAFASTAAIPVVGPNAAAAAAASAATQAASIGAPAIAAAGGVVAGGRFYGGPVDAKSLYRVNEGGAPEVFNAANGKQYMLPNQRGEVVSNANATGGGQLPPIINIIEDKSRAGSITQETGLNGEDVINIVVANIRGDGQIAGTIRGKYGLQSVGY